MALLHTHLTQEKKNSKALGGGVALHATAEKATRREESMFNKTTAGYVLCLEHHTSRALVGSGGAYLYSTQHTAYSIHSLPVARARAAAEPHENVADLRRI